MLRDAYFISDTREISAYKINQPASETTTLHRQFRDAHILPSIF